MTKARFPRSLRARTVAVAAVLTAATLAGGVALAPTALAETAPSALADFYSFELPGSSFNSPVTVLNDDTDPLGRPMTAELLLQASHGKVQLFFDGSFIYTPNAGFTGSDSFTYRAVAGGVKSAPATAFIEVLPNQTPHAKDDFFLAAFNRVLTVNGGVLFNDFDPQSDDILTVSVLSTPKHGTVTFQGKDMTYAADKGFVGDDTFTYRVSDGIHLSNIATVTIRVPGGPNTAPTAVITGGTLASNGLGGTFTVTIGDKETADAGALKVRAGSTNKTLIPEANIKIGGSGANRTLSITAVAPAAVASGTVVFTVQDPTGAIVNLPVNVMVGDNNANTLSGTGSSDLILGRGKNDDLRGNAGIDLIAGGDGNDTMTGNAGADVFRGNAGTNKVLDFSTTDGDTVTEASK